MSILNSLGLTNKDELLNFMRQKIQSALNMEKGLLCDNPFYKAFGINGIFYSDIDDEVTAPIVIIEREELTKLVAIKEIYEYYAELELDEYDLDYDELLKEKCTEINKKYLLATGWSEEKIKSFDNMFGN